MKTVKTLTRFMMWAAILGLTLLAGKCAIGAPPNLERQVLRITLFDGYTFVLENETTIPLMVSITRADATTATMHIPPGRGQHTYENWQEAAVFVKFKIYDPASGRVYKRGNLRRY